MKTDSNPPFPESIGAQPASPQATWLAGATITLRRKSEWHWVAFVQGEEMSPGVTLHGSGVTPDSALSTLASNIQAVRLATANGRDQ